MSYSQILFAVVTLLGVTAAEAELPDGAKLLDPELIWNKAEPLTVVVSPDEQSIAYISQGAIWACNVAGGGRTRLTDLPHTLTEYLAEPGKREAQGDIRKLLTWIDRRDFADAERQLNRVYDLQWARSQFSVFFDWQARWQAQLPLPANAIYSAGLDGQMKPVAKIRREFPDPHGFHVRADKKFAVTLGIVPVIWNIETDRPQATPFDYLVSSTTGDRYLGVEIDTRQLVLVGEDFKIEKRFDVRFGPQQQFALDWSPDERFAIARIFSEQPNDLHWTGLRIDLVDGKTMPIEGDKRDRFVFSSRAEEIFRIGVAPMREGFYWDGGNGSYLSILPADGAPERELVRFDKPSSRNPFVPYPPTQASGETGRFVTAFPRAGEKAGYRFCLVDREGIRTELGKDNESLPVSPYWVVAFADHGEMLVGHDGTRLFSLPLKTALGDKETAK
jgi:hypothetical protein